MRKPKEEKIGKVVLSYLTGQTDLIYSDGDDEDSLLGIFSGDSPSQGVKKALSSSPPWPIYYHLSPRRKNILNWYDFKSGSNILEVGSGCGAVTEGLLRGDNEVTALELSPRRARITAHRHKNCSKLRIWVGNLQDVSSEEKFDYIVCVGVLEYSGKYIKKDDPYLSFLKMLKARLKPDGVLLLAIENQLGMKYLAGANEDHSGEPFSGINDYYQLRGIKTFGRTELDRILKNVGFSENYFYFPFPDYKFPAIVYSQDFYPGLSGVSFPKNLLPTPTPDHRRINIFSEAAFMSIVERNNLFPEFANSFLIEAKVNG